jgi:hypothetical protein
LFVTSLAPVRFEMSLEPSVGAVALKDAVAPQTVPVREHIITATANVFRTLAALVADSIASDFGM